MSRPDDDVPPPSAPAPAPAPEPGPEPAPSPSPSPIPADRSLPRGWNRIGRRRWWTMWAGFSTLSVVLFVFYLSGQAARALAEDIPWPLTLILGVLVVAAGLAVVTLVRNAVYPQPWVNLDTDQLRAGRHEPIPLSAVDRALIPVDPATRSDVLVLRLTGRGARVEIVLRDRRGPSLDPDDTHALAEAVRRTAVAIPTTSYDPTGRFARYNFPGHVDRDSAVALVESPPAPDQPLPASW